MKIWNFKTGTFADEDIAIETIERFYPTDYGYDEPYVYEALMIKGREYVIDDIRSFEYGEQILAHRYSRVRELKMEVTLMRSDYDDEWSYTLKIWKL